MSLINQVRSSSLALIKSRAVQFSLLIGLLILAKATFADDALSGAESTVKDTYNGSIKTYLYVGEGIAALLTLMFTRNIKTLGGVGAMAIFLNVVAALAGI